MRAAIAIVVFAAACGQRPPSAPTASIDNAATTDAGAEPAEASAGARLRFRVEPPDATIKIAGIGDHVGMPYDVDVEPGVYQVDIWRDGFKEHVEQIEIGAGETMTIRVVLERATP